MFFHWTRSRAGRQEVFVPACLIAMSIACSPADAARIEGIAVNNGAITFKFDTPPDAASAFVAGGPNRLAVDLEGTDASRLPSAGDEATVSGWRQSHYTSGTTRIVFDLAQPALIASSGFSEDGRAMTIRLANTDDRSFARGIQAGRMRIGAPGAVRLASLAATRTAAATPPPVTTNAHVNVPIEVPTGYRIHMPKVRGPGGRPLIVLDAGHGGHDAGARGADGQRYEKDAALAIAKAVRDQLLSTGRFRVALTRDDDSFLILGERREIARRLNADLFMSIHCDSAPDPSARGATLYTLSEVSSDKVAARLAAKENKADVLNGVDLGGQTSEVSSILIDLTQRETMNVSANFANLLQRELSPMIAFRTTYHRFAGFVVLKAPDVPSVLFETGYISNPDDEKLLFSKDYQQRIATGATRAIETHFARRLNIETASAD
ncbi:MAG: N-acetylmuramoyl-L-alanine amidase [Sphingomonadaceae bacterium]|nr:N-acetylmuramoyl-L-alanine amidase [Sphingomonadaceae bacterium]